MTIDTQWNVASCMILRHNPVCRLCLKIERKDSSWQIDATSLYGSSFLFSVTMPFFWAEKWDKLIIICISIWKTFLLRPKDTWNSIQHDSICRTSHDCHYCASNLKFTVKVSWKTYKQKISVYLESSPFKQLYPLGYPKHFIAWTLTSCFWGAISQLSFLLICHFVNVGSLYIKNKCWDWFSEILLLVPF